MAIVANCSNPSVYLAIVVVALILCTVSFTEGRPMPFEVAVAAASSPNCTGIYAASSGDTCFGVSQMFNLTPEQFSAINPNLNCDNLFVGQWLCVGGTA